MKRIIGTIRLDTSSPEALCKSVLEGIVSVYVKMRNILPLRGKNDSPVENFAKPVSKDQIEFERQRLKKHKDDKNRSSDDQSKIDDIRFLIIENERDKPPGIEHALDMLEKGLYYAAIKDF